MSATKASIFGTSTEVNESLSGANVAMKIVVDDFHHVFGAIDDIFAWYRVLMSVLSADS